MSTPHAFTQKTTTYKVPNSTLEISRLAFGLATMAEWDQLPLDQTTILTTERFIKSAHDHGITFFDMADQYGFGKSEAAFGEVLKRSPGLRNKIVIQSKCGVLFENVTHGKDVYHVASSSTHILTAADKILRRLQTDHLDILLLHWPDVLMRPEEVAKAFDTLEHSGKVRYFGVSNHTAAQISLLKKYVRQPLVANQVRLGLFSARALAGGLTALWGRRNENTELAATLDYCRLHDIQIQAYAPLRGLLRALQSSSDTASPSAHLAQALTELARSKNTTPIGIGLAWLLHHPAGIVPVFSTASVDHMAENCAAVDVELTDDEFYTLLIAASKLPAET